MENKNIIIIAVLAIIICVLAGGIYAMMNSSVDYERIEITPKGTSIEVPTANAKYEGEINETGCKLWTFKQGGLTTFNSEEAMNARGLSGLGGAIGIKAIEEIIQSQGEKQETDGFTVYKISGEKLNISGRAEMYCIITGNNTTHDNIIIATDNIDITLHMAKSIQYKAMNQTVNATLSEEVSEPESEDTNNNSTTNNKQFTQEDLDKAKNEAYMQGYNDSFSLYDDSDYYYIDDTSTSDSPSDVETTSDSSSSSDSSSDVETTSDSSSSSSSSVETTTG